MTEKELHISMTSGRLSKAQVDVLVDQMSPFPELAEQLFNEVLLEDKEGTFNASWTFDNLMRKKLDYLLPFFGTFVGSLSCLKTESCIRPLAHVCEMVCVAYFKKKDLAFVKNITDEQLEQMMTCCFDWLISPMNMAPKVFSMTSLYYLGMKFSWVHPELKQVLLDTCPTGTTGYQNRAKKTLDKLARLGV
ncbi:hypothetical protein [Flagellimonas pelagia]|uniref:Adenylosuccinate lyase n=2 Tax=Flagellimonas pelagia TaxID=2306998 RepID=A0ABY3KDN9_9FLAO|nr:hypothetical protein [Allomuricauda maritima]TXJ90974.1 hypothetical protein FQ017_18340 [Allomuricauda maritima]